MVADAARDRGIPLHLEGAPGGNGWRAWVFLDAPAPLPEAIALAGVLVPGGIRCRDGRAAGPAGGVRLLPGRTRGPEGVVQLPMHPDGSPTGGRFHLLDPAGTPHPYTPARLQTARWPQATAWPVRAADPAPDPDILARLVRLAHPVRPREGERATDAPPADGGKAPLRAARSLPGFVPTALPSPASVVRGLLRAPLAVAQGLLSGPLLQVMAIVAAVVVALVLLAGLALGVRSFLEVHETVRIESTLAGFQATDRLFTATAHLPLVSYVQGDELFLDDQACTQSVTSRVRVRGTVTRKQVKDRLDELFQADPKGLTRRTRTSRQRQALASLKERVDEFGNDDALSEALRRTVLEVAIDRSRSGEILLEKRLEIMRADTLLQAIGADRLLGTTDTLAIDGYCLRVYDVGIGYADPSDLLQQWSVMRVVCAPPPRVPPPSQGVPGLFASEPDRSQDRWRPRSPEELERRLCGLPGPDLLTINPISSEVQGAFPRSQCDQLDMTVASQDGAVQTASMVELSEKLRTRYGEHWQDVEDNGRLMLAQFLSFGCFAYAGQPSVLAVQTDEDLVRQCDDARMTATAATPRGTP